MTETSSPPPEYTEGPNARLAFFRHGVRSAKPTLLWLGGYKSDMYGGKATSLIPLAEKLGCAYVRFDYSGCGDSEGAFEDGTLGKWLVDALHVIDTLTEGPIVPVGSSMGGWLSLLIARARPERVVGLQLIAPAPDFTEALVPDRWTEAQKETLAQTGRLDIPSEYDDSVMTYTKEFMEEARDHLLLDEGITLEVPAQIVATTGDDVVPVDHVMRVADAITAPSLTLSYLKGGDHRVSRPEDLVRLHQALTSLYEVIDGRDRREFLTEE